MRFLQHILIVILFGLLVLVPAQQAQAIADPDTPPQVNAVYAYSFSDGSVGILVNYYLDYAVTPNETATDAYLVVFVDTDGTTQLKSIAPYAYVDSGYGQGMAWIMFSATEVSTYGITSADAALYKIWLTGNPTAGWSGDPPKTIANIDTWNTTGDMSVLLALRVLFYADVLELAWSLDMVEATSAGNKLTSAGEDYFENVIADLRDLAPACFANSTESPSYVTISYDTAFGATATSGTGNVTGSPVTLSEGTNTVTSTAGTMVFDLAQWTSGNVTNNTGTVTGSPVTLYPGQNTLTVTVGGTFTVLLEVVDSATVKEAGVVGTGWDLTDIATIFGISRWMFSGLLWVILSLIICGFAFGTARKQAGGDAGGFKVVMVLFSILLLGGIIMGLLHPLVGSLSFILYSAVIGYVLFFRSETLHKGFMFMLWMFVMTSIAGNLAASSLFGITATRLTVDISSTESDNISVASTAGFPDSGIIVIGDEYIAYPSKDATAFLDTTYNDIVRGTSGTDADTHSLGDSVRTREASLLNSAIDYKIAQIADSAGLLDYVALPVRLLDLLMTFFILPLEFFGTELAVLTYIWTVVAAGMVVGFVVALVGGRRV